MSTLNSSSTLAEINAAYDDNASYYEDNSVAKARAFVTACTMLIRRLCNSVQRGDSQLQKNVADLREERKTAEEFLATADTDRMGPRVVGVEFTEMRP